MGTHLTDTEVRNAKLPDGKNELVLTDLPGLYLRLRRGANGTVTKSWLYRYTFLGAKRKLTLGPYPQLSLADARIALIEQQRLVSAGQDPVATKEAAEAKRHADELIARLGDKPETLDDLFQQYADKYAKEKYKDGGAAHAACYRLHVQPHLGRVKLEHITTAALSNMLHKVRNHGASAAFSKGHARTVAVVLNLLKSIYDWGYDSGHIDNNPAAALKGKYVGASKGEIGERFLSQDEIKELYYKLEFADMAPRWKTMAWLMLSCLTRVEETSLAKVEHVDLVQKTWRIPVENQKKTHNPNPSDHIVYLSDFACQHMRALLEDASSRKKAAAKTGKDPALFGIYLFPARLVAKGEMPCNEKSATHQYTDRQQDPNAPARSAKKRTQESSELVLPGGRWTSHDLRRTGATWMRRSGEGISNIKDIVECCLNHVVGSVIERTYQKAEFEEKMKLAFETLGSFLTSLIEEAKADTSTFKTYKDQAQKRKEAKNKAQARKMKLTKAKNKIILGGPTKATSQAT